MKQLFIIAAIAIFAGNIFTMCHTDPDPIQTYLDRETNKVAMHHWGFDRVKVVDWPEEFKPLLKDSGEIHSNMAFRITNDTMHVEFEQN